MTVSEKNVIEHDVPVLVIGGGPAGLILALQLAKNGVQCMLAERNLDTTKWPKMDITNCRSMELFNRLGISHGLREVGVPAEFSFDVIFSSGMGDGGEIVSKWNLPSVDEAREYIRTHNDGSQPREPYQRCSQAIFEAWLKPRIQKEPLIDSHFGLKLESLVETETGVESHLVDVTSGLKHIVRSQYAVGCDGAGSRTRKAIGGTLIGGPVPRASYLVHFKSRDLSVLHRQGQFWHIFYTNGGAIIAQDEDDTWTVHTPVTVDFEPESADPYAAVAKALGGSTGDCECKIDKILVTSKWRPNICVVDRYISAGGRVFLSGDAAHQNIPTGGYGMNTAVGDSFDIGWKLAAVINGFGDEHLLKSYEHERQRVAIRNIERSGVHWSVHKRYTTWTNEAGIKTILQKNEDGAKLRSRIDELLTENDGENKEHGIEFGYRNNGSPVIVPDHETSEPPWNERDYVPSTWPGARAPHVFLADGKTSIFDHFGAEYTIVDFSKSGGIASQFGEVAKRLQVPLKQVHLPNEPHAHQIWEREAVLVRPDDVVAWRSPLAETAEIDAENVLKIATGRESAKSATKTNGVHFDEDNPLAAILKTGFTSTMGNVDQTKVKGLAEFQR